MADFIKNVKRNSMMVMGLALSALGIIWGVTSIGYADLTGYFPLVMGLTTSSILLIEARALRFLKGDTYKKLSGEEIVGAFSSFIAGIVFLGSVVNSPLIRPYVAESVKTFFGTFIGVTALIVVLLGFYYAFLVKD